MDETGGRLVGTYTFDSNERLMIHVTGIIEPGPKTRRSATSLFQDGEFQADVFRKIEAEHPEVEHLGSWHTHHVNGYPTLSGGDRRTYKRTVNHKKHNTRFFYALLVVNRNDTASPLERYNIRHFILFRGDPAIYEIPAEAIKILDEPLWWPKNAVSEKQKEKTGINLDEPAVKVADRGIDQQFLKEFFPRLRPFFSNESKTVYWKGTVELIDGTSVALVIAEVIADRDASYAVHIKNAREDLGESIEELKKQRFSSGREAAFTIQRVLNKRLYEMASVADKESSRILDEKVK
ncbi:MAG: hypothetical protein F4079_05420 [Candidatus Dadabacteria bacterium]|nr:hypothetical protein [Candidatus Dadabacteria bacterium]